MRLTKSFSREELGDGQEIIIYGAGRYGELALRGLQHLGLEVAYFVDRRLAGTECFHVPVISPEELEKHKDDAVLIASYNYFGEMLSTLQTIGVRHYYDIISLLELEYDDSKLSGYLRMEKQLSYRYASAVNTAGKEIVIMHCDLVLTECCTLKCRDCANLMQYYKHPGHVDIDELITAFHRFIDSIDMLAELRLIGGEPFLYSNIDRVIAEFVGCEKIQSITIYTNSTIIPDTDLMEILKNKKIAVHLSDYGVSSSKAAQLASIFEKQHISFFVHKYDKWCNCGGIEKRNYSPEQSMSIYQNCLSNQCHTFYRGKLYLCMRSAHGERLGLFRNPLDEVVDFTVETSDLNEKREEIQTWLRPRDSIIACEYCDGMSKSNMTVEAAVQMQSRNPA